MKTPALILVHGYPFDHTLWDHVIPLLGTGVEVWAPDLRGFGGAPVNGEEPALGRMADDIRALLDQHNLGRVVLAGMSMGGYVALAFADHYPGRLAGLGLISSQTYADSDEARANRRAMIQKIRRDGVAVAAKAAVAKTFAPANSQRPELARFPIAGAEKAGSEGLAWALEAMARRPDRSTVLKELRIPTLIVHGLEDQFIPTERVRQMASLATDGRLVEIPGAGHATPLEAPQPVAEALLDLVRRSSEQAASSAGSARAEAEWEGTGKTA